MIPSNGRFDVILDNFRYQGFFAGPTSLVPGRLPREEVGRKFREEACPSIGCLDQPDVESKIWPMIVIIVTFNGDRINVRFFCVI